ncbi:hypothetical protein [Catellatospora sichuanensis]|uniref:hypothetical protein n=1 Tax=Catellatospora sichuanensis TaxID=1969805 RepID=UPI00118372E2|nr:hypothetical protein [Catellatospora sichuanensis]
MRRLTAAAGIAVAMLALTACRSNPSVAAYVGDTTFTEDRVTQLIDQVKAVPNIDPQNVPDRFQVVQLLVLESVCKRAAADLKATLPPVQTQAGQPELAGLQQSLQNCRENLPVKAVQPTPEELREVYDNGVAVGAINGDDPANSFDKVAPQLAQSGELGNALAQRKLLADAAAAGDISVNPRYRPMNFALLSFNQGPALSVGLGQPADAVQAAQPAADTPATPQPQQ